MGASSRPLPGVVRFGAFELNAHSGELRRSGVRVNLQDQPFKILACLLEHPGALVTREDLRERLWPGDTFVDFEQGLNAAVKRLRETLGDSAETPRFVETLPRRGYRFIAPVTSDEGVQPGFEPLVDGRDENRAAGRVRDAVDQSIRVGAPRWRRPLLAVGGIALVLATMAWLRRSTAATAVPPLEVVSLTTLTGSENGPSFSPDGNQVAFAWDGEREENSDIYVKLVGSSEVRRLTHGAATDLAPQWSPDGTQIAYVEAESKTSHRIRLMSSLGGSDRALSHLRVRPPATWSPDGRYLVAGQAAGGAGPQDAGLYVIPVAVGEPRPLTRAAPPANHGWPAVSPDGRHVAYAACQELVYLSNCHVEIVDLDPALAPTGSPRRLTRTPVWTIQGLT
jgi:DNA-binding winged helix-turn-helix (wHTH) protein